MRPSAAREARPAVAVADGSGRRTNDSTIAQQQLGKPAVRIKLSAPARHPIKWGAGQRGS